MNDNTQKRLIGWRSVDYTMETDDPAMAKNWAAAVGVLPIFEGDINTRLTPPPSAMGDIRRQHAAWSDETFGSVGPVGPLKHLAKEAIEAAEQPVSAVPDGWQLVPIEPTQEMVDAHFEGVISGGFHKGYRNMLAATPSSSPEDASNANN